MSEAPAGPEEELILPVAPEPVVDVVPDIEYIVPAEPYDSISTESDLAPMSAPEFAPAAPTGPSDELLAIREVEGSLGRRLDALQSAFEREVRAEATRERVVDRLHAELQEYKQDLLLNTLRPVFIDLIQLHDDIGKLSGAGGADEDGEVGRLLGLMRGFQQGIEDILYRQGVEPYSLEGTTFDPRRQRAASTVPTDDPEIVKTVAQRLRKGFQANEKVIRPEVVAVYTLRK